MIKILIFLHFIVTNLMQKSNGFYFSRNLNSKISKLLQVNKTPTWMFTCCRHIPFSAKEPSWSLSKVQTPRPNNFSSGFSLLMTFRGKAKIVLQNSSECQVVYKRLMKHETYSVSKMQKPPQTFIFHLRKARGDRHQAAWPGGHGRVRPGHLELPSQIQHAASFISVTQQQNKVQESSQYVWCVFV